MPFDPVIPVFKPHQRAPLTVEDVLAFFNKYPGRQFGISELSDKFELSTEGVRKRLAILVNDGRLSRTPGSHATWFVEADEKFKAQPRGRDGDRPLSSEYLKAMRRQFALIKERAL